MPIDESPFDDQPDEPKFDRDPGIGMYPMPVQGTTDLKEPGMFASNDGTVINWLGENFYKACSEQVTVFSSCVKRVGHANDHEDFAGEIKLVSVNENHPPYPKHGHLFGPWMVWSRIREYRKCVHPQCHFHEERIAKG